MADRVVKVSLTAQVSNYLAGMESARKATAAAGSEAEIAARKVEAQNQAMQEAGRGLMAVGLVAIAATALSVKAAIDWESAWAGVTKTVEGTPAELAKVEEGLRSLAKTLPASHEQIAAVAEAAGQLGIQTASVTAFTRTMIDLGETTNLSAEEAATSLARFMNVMGTSQDDVERLGSAIVELGNNYATTEAEIVAMSMRLSGAGKQVGLSEGQVLGLATALSSVGIEAEAGGSAISKVMIDIASSVDSGGERVAQFAKVAGVSAEEFTKQWETDPGAALAGFVQGLGDAESQGKSTIGILEDLGITEVRMRDALLRSASASDIFTEAMATGNSAFEENNALTLEAEKRYATVESQLGVMANRVTDAAISFGQVFLPAITAAADAVGEFADFIGGMDPTLQGIVATVGLVGGAVALAGGVFLLAVPKIVTFQATLAVLATSTLPGVAVGANLASRAISGIGAVAGRVGGVIAVIAVLGTAFDGLRKYTEGLGSSSEEMAASVTGGANALDLFAAATKGMMQNQASDLKLAKEQIGDLDSALIDSIEMSENWGNQLSQGSRLVVQSLEKIGETIGGVASVDLPAAQKAFSRLADETDGSDEKLLALLNTMGPYRDALIIAGKETGIYSDSMTDAQKDSVLLELAQEKAGGAVQTAGEKYIETADKTAALDDEILSLIDSMNKLNGIGQDAVTANGNYQQSLLDIDEQIRLINEGTEGYAATLDQTTQAGIDNYNMLVDVARGNQDAAAAQWELDHNTAEYKLTLEEGHQAVYDRAIALGANADEAKRIADNIAGIPDSKAIAIMLEKEQAERDLRAFINRWNGSSINLTTKVSGRLGSGILQGPDSANGGILPGTPSATDNMYIHAASGEFVTNARSTADPANRRALEFMNNGGSIQGYANGGMVRPQYVTAGGGGGSSYSTVGDTFQASFQLAPLAGRSLSDQAFEAARRLKLRR